MTELKPCPICGGKPNINFCSKQKATKFATIGHGVQGHQVIVYGYGETESYAMQDAIEKWNTRHYPPEVQKMIDEAKPRKLIVSSYDKDIVFCPRCREAFSLKKIRSLRPEIDKSGCPRCKQALDWS